MLLGHSFDQCSNANHNFQVNQSMNAFMDVADRKSVISYVIPRGQGHQKLAPPTPYSNPRYVSHKSSFMPRTHNLWSVLPLCLSKIVYIVFRQRQNQYNFVLSPSPCSLPLFHLLEISCNSSSSFPNIRTKRILEKRFNMRQYYSV